MAMAHRTVSVRASKDDAAEKADASKRIKEVQENLKQLGIDRSTARRVLQIWKAAGATSPDSLRTLFYKRSLGKFFTLVIQLALDAGASAGAFYTGVALGQSKAFGAYTLAVEYLAYCLGMYLALSAALDLFGLGALALATARYSTNADAFLLAVQDLAGQDSSGLDVARKAVSMVKVLQALQSILDMLQGQQGTNQEDFFRNLGAYLTMERAERVYKFSASEYNLTDAQAADIAATFCQFDTNDDGVLDLSEFRRLCGQAAPQLSSEEVEAALNVLDTNSSGTIDFGEFVAWWVQKVQQPETQQQQQQTTV
ncbi:hypothetical protein N2152v2_005897 [Parachlorella kessleri]